VKFGNRLSTEEQIVQHICWDVSTQVVGKGKGKFKCSEANVKLCENWGIPLSFLV
jgi:hypothetical protein